MRKMIFLLIFLIIIKFADGQAHLGFTEYKIRNTYPSKTFITGYTNDGTKYISADMIFGNFTYYFDKETKLSDYCIQIPFSVPAMNGQVESYNKKYVITSETSWTAYLSEGGIMYIKLLYNKENRLSYFAYSNTKFE